MFASHWHRHDTDLATWKPVQFAAYASVPSFFWLMVMVIIGIVFATLAKYKAGRKILLAHPKLFTLGRLVL